MKKTLLSTLLASAAFFTTSYATQVDQSSFTKYCSNFNAHNRNANTGEIFTYLNSVSSDDLARWAQKAEQGDTTRNKKLHKCLIAIAAFKNNATYDPSRNGGFATRLQHLSNAINQSPYAKELAEEINLRITQGVGANSSEEASEDTDTIQSGIKSPTKTPSDLKAITDFNRSLTTQRTFNVDGKEFQLNTDAAISGTKRYDMDTHKYVRQSRKFDDTVVTTVNQDAFKAAKDLIDQGFNPLVVDAANAHRPGGGAQTGHGHTQEESMCYSSLDLLTVLEAAQLFARNSGELDKGNFIPTRGGIYMPHLTVARSKGEIGAPKDYDFLKEPFETAVYATAAFRHKDRLSDPGQLRRGIMDRYNRGEKVIDEQVWRELENPVSYRLWTREKIVSCFEAGIENGHDSLVLCALGNGAFSNPVQETIELFEGVMNQYHGQFKNITFAVLTPPNNTDLYDEYNEAF